MSIEKAGKLFVQLATVENNSSRTQFEMRKKADIAFDQMEAQMLASIKQFPELAKELQNILIQAKQRIIPDWDELLR